MCFPHLYFDPKYMLMYARVGVWKTLCCSNKLLIGLSRKCRSRDGDTWSNENTIKGSVDEAAAVVRFVFLHVCAVVL